MDRYPLLTHGTDVLLHALVVCALYLLLARLAVAPWTRFVAALLFSLSPLTTFAVGWAAAQADRLYVLFACTTVALALRFVQPDARPRRLGPVLMLSAWAAISSKETAMALPLVVALVLFLPAGPAAGTSRARRLAAIACSALPVALFMAMRLPALLASLTGQTQVTHIYTPSPANAPLNVLYYAAYPFMADLPEIATIVFRDAPQLAVAIAVHLLLVALLFRLYRLRGVAIYLTLFFVFLLPVLTLPHRAGHYLYFSAIPTSVALALCLLHPRATPALRAVAALLCTLYLLHGLHNQRFFYDLGQCQNRLLTSLEAALCDAPPQRPLSVALVTDPDAAAHMLHRTFFGRHRVGTHEDVQFHLYDQPPAPGAARPPVDRTLHLAPSCYLYDPRTVGPASAAPPASQPPR